jgi:hypothetical protein
MWVKEGRKARLRWLELDSLESRTLLATIPAATATGAAINLSLSQNFGYADSPTVAINPYDSREAVAVWVVDVPAVTFSIVQGVYTIDGGADWNPLPGTVANPSGIQQVLDGFAEVTDPSVGFDSQGNAYVLDSQHAAVATSPTGSPIPTAGVMALSKFTFSGTGSGATIAPDYINNVVYQWVSNTDGDAVLNPVMAVDPGTYPNDTAESTPPAGLAQDAHANNIYIAWVSNDVQPAEVTYPGVFGLFNPNRIQLIVSSDGGQSFSDPTTVNQSGETTATVGSGVTFDHPDDGNALDLGSPLVQDNAHVSLVVNPGGGITVGWDNLETGALQSNAVQAGQSTPATQLTNSIGNLFSPVTTAPQGNWVQPAFAGYSVQLMPWGTARACRPRARTSSSPAPTTPACSTSGSSMPPACSPTTTRRWRPACSISCPPTRPAPSCRTRRSRA